MPKYILRRTASLTAMLLLAIATALANVHTPDYYNYNVRDHFRNQRWKAGKELLDQAMPLYGTLSVINELQGWYYYHYKKYVQARFYLIRSLRDEPTNQHARELLVNVEEETHNYSSAICYINEILEYNPYARGWWRRKIEIFRKMGNQQEADRLLVRLRQIYPQDQQIQKDIDYQNELKLATLKKQGDIDGQIKVLRQLTSSDSQNPDYFLNLANLLLQQGDVEEAAEVAAKGARVTKSPALVKKRVSILLEQARYQEASAYLKECQNTLHIPGLGQLLSDIDEDAAYNSVFYDAYIMYGKLYEKNHSSEALDFLVNTAVTRGYYDDAIYYINLKRKAEGDSENLLYKLYLSYRRMGDTQAANRTLEQIALRYPNNIDAIEETCNLYYNRATENMQVGEYDEAIPQLLYVATHTGDSIMRRSSNTRLFTCYLEMKYYDMAEAHLDSIRSLYGETAYTMNKASIYNMQGRTEDALALLAQAYEQTDSAGLRNKIAGTYEEIAQPYIKRLMAQGLTRQAFSVAYAASNICTHSHDILRYGINTADALKYRDEYIELVNNGIQRFPGDPFFIVKKASVAALDGDYKAALDSIAPLVPVYLGDSSIINAYAEYSNLYALQLMKSNKCESALPTVNSALEYTPNNRELLYTKGLIFEKMQMYDSAYVYQRFYQPSALETPDFRAHLNELQYRKATNQLAFEYQHAVNSANTSRTGNASLTYQRKYRLNSYTYTLGYAGRDGLANDDSGVNSELEYGGLGIQLGFSWEHRLSTRRLLTLGLSASNNFFPLLSAKAALAFELDHGWTIQPRASLRIINSYTKQYAIEANPEYEEGTSNPSDSTLVQFKGWNRHRRFLISAGASVQKELGQFNLAAAADLFFMHSKFFWNASGKMQYFPVEGRLSHFFAMTGLGSAPEASIIDSSMPGTFSHLNSFVGMGGLYVINKTMSVMLSGNWYTLYNQSVGLDDAYTLTFSTTTTYANYFYLNAQVFINF